MFQHWPTCRARIDRHHHVERRWRTSSETFSSSATPTAPAAASTLAQAETSPTLLCCLHHTCCYSSISFNSKLHKSAHLSDTSRCRSYREDVGTLRWRRCHVLSFAGVTIFSHNNTQQYTVYNDINRQLYSACLTADPYKLHVNSFVQICSFWRRWLFPVRDCVHWSILT